LSENKKFGIEFKNEISLWKKKSTTQKVHYGIKILRMFWKRDL